MYQAEGLTCPAEKLLTLCSSWVFTNITNICPSFLSGSVQFFLLMLLRQSSYLFSLTWAMVGHFSALLLLHHCLQFEFEPIWPGESRDCAGEGRCPVRTAKGGCQQCLHQHDWHFSDTPLGSDCLCWFLSGGFLQFKLQPLGGATDSGFHHRWPVSYYMIYCLFRS